jgi:CBS domain containing-hemolysin-like protein
MKDLLPAIAECGKIDDIAAMLRPPILLPLDTPVLDVIKRFRAGHTHLALGVEDSGRVAGFFTLEDEQAPGAAGLAPAAADGELTISGGTPIYRPERLLERHIDAPADVNSIGGLIIHRLERLPIEGETLAFDGFELTVRTMRRARPQVIVVHPKTVLPEEAP